MLTQSTLLAYHVFTVNIGEVTMNHYLLFKTIHLWMVFKPA